MKILILHLSDLHTKLDDHVLKDKIAAIDGVINQLSPGISQCFIVLSGDISFSGAPDQFALVEEYLNRIKDEAISKKLFDKVEFIPVPGNHDVDMHLDTEARRTLIKNIKDNYAADVDSSVVKILTDPQRHFFSFFHQISTAYKSEYPGLHQRFTFNCGDTSIVFDCFNTAWMSTVPDIEGTLRFPIASLHLETLPDNAISFSVLHHPYDWFSSRDRRILRSYLLANSNFVLTGHEHELESYLVKDFQGKICEYVEGGIMSDNASDKASFNAIIIDVDGRKVQLAQYVSEKVGYHMAFKTEWNSIQPRHSDSSFIVNDVYMKTLDSTDFDFKHPRKDPLLLSDIYVDPDLGKVSKEMAKSADLKMSELKELLISGKHLLVIGSPQGGKTALLRRLFCDLISEGKCVPIIMDGRQLINVDEQHIFSLIERTFENAYSKTLLETYSQLPKSRKVLMIDDFDKSNLNARGRARVLKQVESIFENIILSSTSLMAIEELEPDEEMSLFEYERLALSEFGYYLRGKLIEKWLRVGVQYNISDTDFKERVKFLEHEINSVAGNHILPYNPFIMLTLLQACDLNYDISTATGAYGYYYEILIKHQIASSSRSNKETGIKIGFLSCLAYFMFTNQNQQISSAAMLDFSVKVYKPHSKLTIDANRLISDLVSSRVLLFDGALYTFAHNYEYQYFVALFMADNLKSPDRALSHHINQTILRLCTNLHKENYSNIVMFVSYLSKDPIVLDLLIANADRLFTDVLPCDLDKNVGFINKLEPHKIITSFSDVPEEQSREAVLRSQDHVERDASKSLISQGEVDDIDKLEVVPSIVYSFALINILGQILRNYLGTMDSTHKQKIVDTSYRLGLRVLELAFINMEGDLSHLKQHFMESVRAKNKRITEHELDTRFTNYISATTILLSMLVVRSVTLAVGAPELDQVYEDVQKQLDLPSIALLNMSLQLEHYKGHPVKQVIEMHKAAKKNPFLSELIRQLVLLNLYLYPWPALERQKVLAEFGMQKTQNWPRFLLPKGKLIKKVDPRA